MGRKWVLVVAAIFIVMILAGEAVAYGGGCSYDSSAERDGDVVSYSVSSSGTNDYTAVLIDNHGFTPLERLAIYVDECYANNIDEASGLSVILRNDVNYYADQIKKLLAIRSFKDVVICDSKGLIDFVNKSFDDPRSYGVYSVSYSLPGEIYSGNADDRLMQWISKGGSLYWMGSIPGAFYYDENGRLAQVPDCQELFFGAPDCVKGDEYGNPVINDNVYTRSLSLLNEYTELGVDVTRITDEHLAMGAIDGNYSSATLIRYGDGMVAQFSGRFEIVQAEDATHIIASKICYKSTIAGYEGGRVTRTTQNGSFTSSDGDILYVFIGNSYSVYGRAWDV